MKSSRASRGVTRRQALGALGVLLALATLRAAQEKLAPIVWRLENTLTVGGEKPTLLGAPRAITEAGRRALQFNGTSDGLIVGQNPLRGARAFTIEVCFRPDADGPAAQRFVHVEDATLNRALIETRVTPEGQWYLDTFLYAHPREPGLTLVDRTKLHPCGRWYWAALVYDGKTMAHFVDGVKEKDGAIAFGPMGEGSTSVGVRLNRVFWFKGGIAEVRFHARALERAELQRPADAR